MAIIYQADLSPSKPEILHALLSSRPWGEEGELEVLGAYRFDDPAGEVGVECHLVRVGETLYHLPLTYRAEPLEGGQDALIGTMQHSVLGERHVYDGLQDDVALDCFRRALSGAQQQASLDLHDADGNPTGTAPQQVTLDLEVDGGGQPPSAEDLLEGRAFTVARTIGELAGAARLVASWHGGRGVVAAC